MSGKQTSEALTRYWRQQIEAWQASGQSQRAFCVANDLDYYRFGYWWRKFRRQAADTQRRTPPAFLPVVPHASAVSSELSLELPGGAVVRGIGPENVALVSQLLRQLL